MKQFSVYVQMANKRYCHDIVTAEDETGEAAKAAEKKAIAIANEILERYKGEGVYCFVYIHDEEFTIYYEGDNVTPIESTVGDRTSLADILSKQHTSNIMLAQGKTKEGNKKFISMDIELTRTAYVKTTYTTYVCDPGMCKTIKRKICRHLDSAIELYNTL